MAGLIAANGRAIGIAPGASILPVRRSGFGAGIDIGSADAINWAIDHGATVLCLAFVVDPSRDVQAAIERAIQHDVVVVAGVGNTPARSPQYPASYPGVVGAAGVDRDGRRAEVSIESPAAVLSAPAVDITSTASRLVDSDGYRIATGTSDATAIIAGVAALVRAKFPDLSAEEVIHRMTATAQDRGAPGRDDEYGYGIVDPVAALTADVLQITTPPPTTVDDGSGTASRTIILAAALGTGLLIIVGLALALRSRRRS
jgi:subtilisin family serine protease